MLQGQNDTIQDVTWQLHCCPGVFAVNVTANGQLTYHSRALTENIYTMEKQKGIF